MKLITAVIRPATFDSLKDALSLFGVRGMTVAQVLRTTGLTDHVEIYRGQRFVTDLEPNLRVDLLAPNDEVADLLRVIGRFLAPAEGADERVWTTEVNLVVRVRTNEHGLDAL